jgi:hypothetical protein
MIPHPAQKPDALDGNDTRKRFVHLLLGHPDDLCCAGVAARLEACGLPVRILGAPLAPPARLDWRLDGAGLSSRLTWDGLPAAEIDGVLVRSTGWVDPEGWEPADHAYMQAEVRAATLAWLAGLTCPVVNRPDAALWYRTGAPLLAWRPLLGRCGLPLAEIVVTNDPAEAARFRARLAATGIAGAVYTPLTTPAGYPLATDADWQGLAGLQDRTPVCLSEPHGAVHSACLAGDTIVWDGDPPRAAVALEPALRRFAAAACLAFVEIALAPVRGGLAVTLVDPDPRLEHFAPPARARILDALVALLAPAGAVAEALP